jgi:DNA polymerase
MPDVSPSRQVTQHLAGLKAAGLDFVPATPPVPILIEPVEAPAAEVGGEESRRVALSLMADEVAACNRCKELYSTRTQTVFGVGRLSPDVCFVGEAPGADEDRQGEPFVGAAGQLLNKIIAAMGLARDDVYICNTLKCRPPKNRTPSPDECTNCRPYFERQIELVAPQLICCLGATAAKNVLRSTQGINRLRGRWHDYNGIPVMCTFHPAALLRDPALKRDTWDDMKLILHRLGRPVPAK